MIACGGTTLFDWVAIVVLGLIGFAFLLFMAVAIVAVRRGDFW